MGYHATQDCNLHLLIDITGLHYALSREQPALWTIYLGRETQSGPNIHEVKRTLSKIIVHPDYNKTSLNNDIALMKLSSPVSFTNYIRPVCLASNTSKFYTSTSCWATGWGNLGKDGEDPAGLLKECFYALSSMQRPQV